MIRFGAYILLTMSIGISLWFFGITTPVTLILGIQPNGVGGAYDPTGVGVYQGKPFELSNFVQNIGQLMSSTGAITQLLGITAVVIGVTALTGFSSMYFIPVALLLFMVNYVAMPVSSDVLNASCMHATDPTACVNAGGGLPAFIYYPILLIFNMLTIMAIISFIRGGV
jgi:hypothetical protein